MRAAVGGVQALLKVSQALSQCAGSALTWGVNPLGHHISIELMWCPICCQARPDGSVPKHKLPPELCVSMIHQTWMLFEKM
jgi:hypothetical protein